MAAKDFSNLSTKRVYTSIADATADNEENKQVVQEASDDEKLKEAQQTMKTQGRRGMKCVRINMAFSLDNHDYIKTMAAVSGKSITMWINDLIAAHKDEHEDLYKKAIEFREESQKLKYM